MSKAVQLEIISSRFHEMSLPEEINWSMSFTGSDLIDYLVGESLSVLETCSIAELRLILAKICSKFVKIGVFESQSSDLNFELSLLYSLKHITLTKTIETMQRQLSDHKSCQNEQRIVNSTQQLPPPPPPLPPPPMSHLQLFQALPPPPPPPFQCPIMANLQESQQPNISNHKVENKSQVQLSPLLQSNKNSSNMNSVIPPPLPCATMSATCWNLQKPTLRKGQITPIVPMKPLYWNRILIPITNENGDNESVIKLDDKKQLWTEIQEQKLPNLKEFVDLFSRQVSIRKSISRKKVDESPIVSVCNNSTKKIKPAKILDSKRAQNVGILAKSLHIDFAEIEHSIYNFDTSIVNLEALQQIYEARATDEELENIRKHVKNKPDVPLDQSEQFLYDLAEIPNFADRIFCFMFQASFDDQINTVTNTLANLKFTCKFMSNNENLRKVFAIILTLGNYMNGGNMTRGQADGFGLEILPKLKDVKSNNSQLTLLDFIVRSYMLEMNIDGAMLLQNQQLNSIQLPVPEPGDVARTTNVDFDDLHSELSKLDLKLKDCKKIVNGVITCSTAESLEPFQSKMEKFLREANKRLKVELDSMTECKTIFLQTMQFYGYPAKLKEQNSSCDIKPKDFFSLWHNFCLDFKNVWTREQQRLMKERVKELRSRRDSRSTSETKIKKRENGLKAKIEKLRQRDIFQ